MELTRDLYPHSTPLWSPTLIPEWVYLIPEYFGKQRVDGWVCYAPHTINKVSDGTAVCLASDVETKLEQKRIEAEFLCPYKTL